MPASRFHPSTVGFPAGPVQGRWRRVKSAVLLRQAFDTIGRLPALAMWYLATVVRQTLLRTARRSNATWRFPAKSNPTPEGL